MKKDAFKGITTKKFNNRFSKDEDCYRYLSELKWSDDTFVCKRCGNTNYCKGHLPFSRRCTRCKHDESPMAGTMFDKIRFSLLTAFQLIFELSTTQNGTTTSLSSKYDIRQKTIWEFKQKLQLVMSIPEEEQLCNNVYISMFDIENNRKQQTSNIVIVALEIINENEIGLACAKVIDGTSKKSVTEFLNSHINSDATAFINKERKNNYLIDNYNVQLIANSDTISIFDSHIEDLKKWIYATYRNCSHEYLQNYLNEYYFKFNKRKQKSTIFHSLVELMVNNSPSRTKSRL